jgi:CRISPR/Cas system-associated exonuclease Cas4 (RecB family)
MIPERHPEHVSVSELREFLSCPLRWWYKYRLGMWTEKTTPYFALGTSVHAGLQKWYEPITGGKQHGDLTKVFDYYRKTWALESSKVDWTGEKDRDLLSEGFNGEEMLRAAIYAGDDWEAKAVEHAMFSEIKHSKLGKLPIKLKTQVDMLTKGLDVVEHKTAQRKWEAEREHGDIQATAYALAVRENYSHDPTVTFNIISNSAKGPNVDRRMTTRTQSEIDKLYIGARAFVDAIEKGAIYPNPTAFAHATCEFKSLCNDWESHPQKLPDTRKKLYDKVPTLKKDLWPDHDW